MLKLKLINSPKPLKIKFSYNFPDVLPVVLEEKTITPKIVDQIIIPSSNYDGMSQVTVNAVDNTIDENIKSENIKKDISILGVQGNVEELKGTKLEVTKNGTYIPEEPHNAFTEVDVNMEPDLSDYFGGKLKAGNNYDRPYLYLNVKKIPMLEIEGTSCQYMFASCSLLETISLLDTSKVTNMNSMFVYCSKLISIPLLDTSKVTNMRGMFNNCLSLTNVPPLDTSNVTSMNTTFRSCSSLVSIPSLDTSKVTNFDQTFQSDTNLETIPILNASNVTSIYYTFSDCSNLKNLGGLQNLGQAYSTTASANYGDYKLNLSESSKLTHDSLMNVINNLYDIATKGVKTQQLFLGSTNMAKLTAEEIAIATNKGWSVS